MKRLKKFTVVLFSAFAMFMLSMGMAFGFTSVANAEETVGGTPATVAETETNEAQIGTQKYPTFAEAYGAAQAGDTITLLNPITLSAAFKIEKGITLDLNKKTITVSKDYISVNKADADVIIKNGTIDAKSTAKAAVFTTAARSIEYNGVTVTGECAIGLYTSISTANLATKVTYKNCNVTAKSYGIYVKQNAASGSKLLGDIEITDCVVNCSSSAKIFGMSVGAGSGKRIISNCNVTCVQTANGKSTFGIDVMGAGNATISDCTITCTTVDENVIGLVLSHCTNDITINNFTATVKTKAEKTGVTNFNTLYRNIGSVYGIYTQGCTGNLTIGGTNKITMGLTDDSALTDASKIIFGKAIDDTGSGDTNISGYYDFEKCEIGIHLKKVPTFTENALVNISHAYITGVVYNAITNSCKSEVTVNGCVINIGKEGDGISGNGNNTGTNLKVINTIINAGTGLYHPQDGTLIIDGGEINAVTLGVEIRGGNLIVRNNTIINVDMNTAYGDHENGNGSTVTGAAIAVSQHTTNHPINVEIEKATLSAQMSLVQVDPEKAIIEEKGQKPSPVIIRVLDGDFVGGVKTERVLHFISGGEFDTLPKTEYIVEGNHSYHEENDMYIVLPDVAPDRFEANDYVRLYAATLHVKYTDEIKNIIFNEALTTVEQIETAKEEAIAKVDDIYKKLVDFKNTAITDIKTAAARKEATATEEALEEVVVPTSTYSAIYEALDENEVTALKDNAIAEITDIRTSRKQAQELENKVDGLDTKVDELGTQVGEVGTQVGELDSKVDELGTQVGEVGTQIDGLDTKVDGIGDKTDKVNTGVGELGTQIDGLDTKVDGIGDKTDKVNTEVGELGTQIDGLETKVDGIGDKTDKVNTEVGELGTQIDGLDTKVDGIGEKIDGLNLATDDKDSVSMTGVYVLFSVVIVITAAILIFVIILAVRKSRKEDEEDNKDVPGDKAPETEENPEDGKAPEVDGETGDKAPEEDSDYGELDDDHPDDNYAELDDEEAVDDDEEYGSAQVGNVDGAEAAANAEVAAQADAFGFGRRPHKTFETRLKELPDQTLELYSTLKNELCRYENVKSRICRSCESFHVGHKLVAKMKMSSRSARLYLALDPNAYAENKYHHVDKSEVKAYAHVPMMVKVNGPRSIVRAENLIADCLKDEKKDDAYVWVDYAEQIKQQAAQAEATEQN